MPKRSGKLTPGVTKSKSPRIPHQKDTSRLVKKLVRGGSVVNNMSGSALSRLVERLGILTDHAVLSNLQGGTTAEFYHMTAEEYGVFDIASGADAASIAVDADGNITFPNALDVTGTITGNVTGNVTGDVTGNADTATALETARTINGTSFDGTANVTVTAAAGTLTGATLNGTVLASSLTSTGALNSGSITSGFGTINNGASAITTTGVVSTGALGVTGNVTVTGTVDGVDLAALNTIVGGVTEAEMDQVENIGTTTISASQWGYLGGMDQALAQASNVTFNQITGTLQTAAQTNITSVGTLTSLVVTNNITVGGTVDGVDIAALDTIVGGVTAAEMDQIENIGATTISSAQWGYVGALDQNLITTSDVTHNKLTATAGILFGTDTAAVNTLDDYEEGTWTPTISTGITSPTYGGTGGLYTKIGNFIFVKAFIQLTGGTPNGSVVTISGLPFDVYNGNGFVVPGNIFFTGTATLPSTSLILYGNDSTDDLNIGYQTTTAVVELIGTDIGASAAMEFSIFYTVA